MQLLIEKRTSPQSIGNSAAWTKKKKCIFSNCVNINFNEIMIFAGYKQIVTGVGHFQVSRETGLLLCRIALWDCFGDAIAYFIGYYNCAGNWVKFRPQNIPIVQFDKTPTRLKHHLQLHH